MPDPGLHAEARGRRRAKQQGLLHGEACVALDEARAVSRGCGLVFAMLVAACSDDRSVAPVENAAIGPHAPAEAPPPSSTRGTEFVTARDELHRALSQVGYPETADRWPALRILASGGEDAARVITGSIVADESNPYLEVLIVMIGDRSVPALLEIIEDRERAEWARLRLAAIGRSVGFGRHEQAVVEACMAALEHPGRYALELADVLSANRGIRERAAPYLAEKVRATLDRGIAAGDVVPLQVALVVLAKVGSEGAFAAPIVARALDVSELCYFALDALGSMGTGAHAASADLVRWADSSNLDLRRRAIWAIGRVAPDQHLGVLFQASGDPDDYTAVVAIEALTESSALHARQEVLDLLLLRLHDARPMVFDAAAAALNESRHPGAVGLLVDEAAASGRNSAGVMEMLLDRIGEPALTNAVTSRLPVAEPLARLRMFRLLPPAVARAAGGEEAVLAGLRSAVVDIRCESVETAASLAGGSPVLAHALSSALRDADAGTRATAFNMLESLPAEVLADLTDLATALRDPRDDVRVDAARLICRSGRDVAAAVAELGRHLEPGSRLITAAMEPVERLQGDAAPLAGPLARLLLSDPQRGTSAARALLHTGSAGIELLRSHWASVTTAARREVLEEVLRLPPPREPSLGPLVVTAASDPDEATRRLAAAAAGALPAEQSVELLMQLLKDPEPHVRGAAAREMANVGEAAEAALPLLYGLLSDTARACRVEAAGAVWAIAGDRSVAGTLREAAESQDLLVGTWRAVELLAHMRPDDDNSIAVLATALHFWAPASDVPDDVVVALMRSLAARGDRSALAVGALASLVAAEAPSGRGPGFARLRMEAASTLGSIGSPAEPAIPALEGAARSSDEEVASAATRAIAQIVSAR